MVKFLLFYLPKSRWGSVLFGGGAGIDNGPKVSSSQRSGDSAMHEVKTVLQELVILFDQWEFAPEELLESGADLPGLRVWLLRLRAFLSD